MALQLEFFKTREEVEIEELRNQLLETKKSLDKVRKGTYATINEIKKVCEELNVRQGVIERNICKS